MQRDSENSARIEIKMQTKDRYIWTRRKNDSKDKKSGKKKNIANMTERKDLQGKDGEIRNGKTE